jgi:hypothetical protein
MQKAEGEAVQRQTALERARVCALLLELNLFCKPEHGHA